MIEIIHVSKKFRIWEDRSRDLKETTINFLRGKKRSFRDVWALQGIHLNIEEGETVAFIGENGSGKSTLLKLLGGIYSPDEGRIVARGKISTLFELGVGFHPDLTGEENVYLNGAMLGFDQAEMRERFDEIVSFSEIGDFVYSPIRTYSSGMLMRLGFSIAMCVNPDILLIDEVLAVGDEGFQEKCFERLGGFKRSGKTIVLVSHGMEMVEKFCDRAVLLHEGRVVCDDVPTKTIEAYHAVLYGDRHRPAAGDDLEPEKSEAEGAPSDKGSHDEDSSEAGEGRAIASDGGQGTGKRRSCGPGGAFSGVPVRRGREDRSRKDQDHRDRGPLLFRRAPLPGMFRSRFALESQKLCCGLPRFRRSVFVHLRCCWIHPYGVRQR